MNKFARSAFAVAASGVLVLGSAGIAAAQGAPGPGGPGTGFGPTPPADECNGVICDTMEAAENEGMKLHVHKYVNANATTRGDGTQIEDTGALGEPLNGVIFKVEKVNDVDLTTNEGQKKAEQIAKGTAEAPGFTTVGTKTTSNGQAVFDIEEIGLYRVTETAAPAGYEAAEAESFYVAMPLTDPENRQGFLREVHVYPKNKKQEDVVTKSVTDAATVTSGDTITYNVEAKVPTASSLAKVTLTDTYPADRLENPEVKRVYLGDGQDLEPGDYNVDKSTEGKVVIDLTAEGIKKVVEKTGDARKVQAEISFTVKEEAADQTSPIKNNASITTSIDEDDPGTTVDIPEEDQPETYFGKVKINKTNTAGQGIKATFDLYTCNADKEIVEDNQVTEGIEVAAEGTTIDGLHVNDYVNGEAKTTEPTGYCLVETAASEGYELLPEPVYFTVSKDEIAEVKGVDIQNVEDNAGFDLPLTGGRGVTMLLVLGGVLIVGGGAYAFYSNRRQNAAS